MAMNHVTELLCAYLDNELDNEEASQVKGHLETCPACQKEERLLTASWEMLGSLETIEPSLDFRARFWERVREEEEKKVSWLSFPRLVPVMASVLGVWVIGVGLGSYLFLRSPRAQTSSLTALQQRAFLDDTSGLSSAYLMRMTRENV